MQKKKVLIISRVKSTKYGDSTRPYYLGEGLQKNGYDVTNVCFIDKIENDVRYISLFEKGKDKLKHVFGTFKKLKELVNNDFDYIYGHQLLGGLLAVLIKKKKLKKAFTIVDAHTSETLENTNAPNVSDFKTSLITKIEKYVLKKVDSIITVSKESKEEFIKLGIDESKVNIVKNGSTPNTIFQTDKNQNLESKYNLSPNKTGVFINPRDNFFSNHLADELINKWALELYKKDPEITILIIGGGDVPDSISPNVKYTGFVDDYNDYLNLGDFYLSIYPEIAVCGGTRNKVCDYIMLSKPIVSTKEGMRGFDDLQKNVHYIEVNNQQEFTDSILDLVNNDGLISQISNNISNKKDAYDWETAVILLTNLFNQYDSK